MEDAIDLGGSYQFDPPSGNYIAIVRVEGTIQEQTESSASKRPVDISMIQR